MQGVSKKSNSPISNLVGPAPVVSSTDEESSDEFSQMLIKNLSSLGKKQISEEELFSAVARERVAHFKGDDAANEFDSAMESAEKMTPAPGKTMSYEACTQTAIESMESSGGLSKDEGNLIYSQSFAASQLDSNRNALYDDVGSTQATASMESAVEKAKRGVANFDSGSWKAPAREVTDTPDSGTVKPASPRNGSIDGAGGFLYKAFSDIDGNVLILAPTSMTGNIEKVNLRDSHGRIVDSAESQGLGYTPREHIRFKKSGSEYPTSLTAEFVLKSGVTQSFLIPDSSLTWD